MNICLVTVVAGTEAVDVFLRVTLRSLLANGNLVDLAKRHSTIYRIYTTRDDARRMEADPVFSALRAEADVQISLVSRPVADFHASGGKDLRAHGCELARRNGAILFLLEPNLLCAAGTLIRWADRFEDGYRAIYGPELQVVHETAVSELDQHFGGSTAIELDDAAIRDILFRHMHPSSAALLPGHAERVGHPTHDIRPVTGRGMVVRLLGTQPLGLAPADFTRLKGLTPCDHLDRIAFVPATVVGLSPMLENGACGPDQAPERSQLTQLGAWWNAVGLPGDKRLDHPYGFCLHDDDGWRRAYSRAVGEGRFFVTQLRVGARIAHLAAGLAERNLSHAAKMLATAAYVSRLRRGRMLRGDETIFVPTDAAFAGASGERIRELLKPGREAELTRMLYAHVARYDTAEGEWSTLAGKTLAQSAPGAQIVEGPIALAGFTVYLVDRIFGQPQPQTAGSSSISTLLVNVRGIVNNRMQRSKRAAFEAGSQAAWNLLRRNRNLLRRIFIAFEIGSVAVQWLSRRRTHCQLCVPPWITCHARAPAR